MKTNRLSATLDKVSSVVLPLLSGQKELCCTTPLCSHGAGFCSLESLTVGSFYVGSFGQRPLKQSGVKMPSYILKPSHNSLPHNT